MGLASTTPRTTRTGGAGFTRSLPTLLTTVLAAHTATTTSSARPLVALSLWIVLVPGLRMAPATTRVQTTRTTGAGTTCTPRAPLTTDTAAHTPTTTSSALSLVALSQWIVLVPGLRMDLATMTPLTTRTGGADCTRSLPMLPTTDTDVLILTTTSLARPLLALSLLTVLVPGMPTDLASTTRLTTRTGGASTTRSAPMLLTTDMGALTPTTRSLARLVGVPSL